MTLYHRMRHYAATVAAARHHLGDLVLPDCYNFSLLPSRWKCFCRARAS
jgi:hypothetical protein